MQIGNQIIQITDVLFLRILKEVNLVHNLKSSPSCAFTGGVSKGVGFLCVVTMITVKSICSSQLTCLGNI